MACALWPRWICVVVPAHTRTSKLESWPSVDAIAKDKGQMYSSLKPSPCLACLLVQKGSQQEPWKAEVVESGAPGRLAKLPGMWLKRVARDRARVKGETRRDETEASAGQLHILSCRLQVVRLVRPSPSALGPLSHIVPVGVPPARRCRWGVVATTGTGPREARSVRTQREPRSHMLSVCARVTLMTELCVEPNGPYG